MLEQKVLLAISGVRMSYLLRKLLLRHIGGRTSMQWWQLVVKMAPTWNFILQVCKFFGSFVIYTIYYTSSVLKFEIKSKSNCVCDNRNVFKCVLFLTEFWSCLKSGKFCNFSWQLWLHRRVCVCVCLNNYVALLEVHMRQRQKLERYHQSHGRNSQRESKCNYRKPVRKSLYTLGY